MSALRKVLCPSFKPVLGAIRICHRVVDEVPQHYGAVEVTVLKQGRYSHTGRGRLACCPQCGTWLEIVYAGLRAAS